MHRIAHGSNSIQVEEAPLVTVEEGNNNPVIALDPAVVNTVAVVSSAAATPAVPPVPHFTYLFKDLVNNQDAHLPDVPTILRDLKDLGLSMRDKEHKVAGDSNIPAAYTYFGQFVNHDISFMDAKKPENSTDAGVLGDDMQLAPWPENKIHTDIKNKRASILDLDCLYGLIPSEKEEERTPPPPSESNPEMIKLGLVSKSGDRPPGKTDNDDYDLLRGGMSKEPKFDRAAFIPDPRNDTHLIVSQLHVAFLRAHNNLVKDGNSFKQARRILRDCYHWAIVHDFLMRIADPVIVKQVLESKDRLYKPPQQGPFSLPLEFTVAAFRFGHSMVRKGYYVSDTARFVLLNRLYMLIIMGKDLKPKPGLGYPSLPENMIIQWEAFLPGTDVKNKARQINTRIVEPLFNLLDETNVPVNGELSIAVQDLKRGYMFRLPTGQAVAKELGITNPITSKEIEDNACTVNEAQVKALTRSETQLSSHTPLWFYILAEAAIRGKGNQLGPVGSRLVAEVFIGLIRRIPDSFLHTGWKPGHLGFNKDEFTITDLLRLAKVVRKNF
jgi:hypothetical protein